MKKNWAASLCLIALLMLGSMPDLRAYEFSAPSVSIQYTQNRENRLAYSQWSLALYNSASDSKGVIWYAGVTSIENIFTDPDGTVHHYISYVSPIPDPNRTELSQGGANSYMQSVGAYQISLKVNYVKYSRYMVGIDIYGNPVYEYMNDGQFSEVKSASLNCVNELTIETVSAKCVDDYIRNVRSANFRVVVSGGIGSRVLVYTYCIKSPDNCLNPYGVENIIHSYFSNGPNEWVGRVDLPGDYTFIVRVNDDYGQGWKTMSVNLTVPNNLRAKSWPEIKNGTVVLHSTVEGALGGRTFLGMP